MATEGTAMVVVMRHTATDDDVTKVVDAVNEVGGDAFVSRGRHQTIVGLVGDLAQFSELPLHAFPGVEDVIRVSKPYKLVSIETHPRPSTVYVGDVPIGRDTFTLIAGPCAVETEDQTAAACRMARDAGAVILRGGAYKPRTSPYAFQGLGEKGLDILTDVARDLDMPVVTEVVTTADVETVAAKADMLQVGTRNMQNFQLLREVGMAEQARAAQARHAARRSTSGSWPPSTSRTRATCRSCSASAGSAPTSPRPATPWTSRPCPSPSR